MEIITGYTGENHVTSMDDASLYRGIFGQGDYVLDVGNKFAATIINNNTVRIMDGDLVIQGHQARIRANDYEEVTIDNGTHGQKRNDLIVARYQKNTTTGIESITLEVVKGTPGETATDPDIIQEDLSTGGTQRDFALYRVTLNGLVLKSVTSLFTVIPNLKDLLFLVHFFLMTHQAESAQKHITESGENANGSYIRFDDGTQICWYVGEQTVRIDNVLISGLYYGVLNLNFPASFIDRPAASIGHTVHPKSGASWGLVRGTSSTRVTINYLYPVSCSSASMIVSYIAIGRWK